jgi:hypothetical protein
MRSTRVNEHRRTRVDPWPMPGGQRAARLNPVSPTALRVVCWMTSRRLPRLFARRCCLASSCTRHDERVPAPRHRILMRRMLASVPSRACAAACMARGGISQRFWGACDRSLPGHTSRRLGPFTSRGWPPRIEIRGEACRTRRLPAVLTSPRTSAALACGRPQRVATACGRPPGTDCPQTVRGTHGSRWF